jgi:hypothetical protein
MSGLLNPCATSFSPSSSQGVSTVAAASRGFIPMRVGKVEGFREQGRGHAQRAAEVLGRANVERLVGDAVAVAECAGRCSQFHKILNMAIFSSGRCLQRADRRCTWFRSGGSPDTTSPLVTGLPAPRLPVGAASERLRIRREVA